MFVVKSSVFGGEIHVKHSALSKTIRSEKEPIQDCGRRLTLSSLAEPTLLHKDLAQPTENNRKLDHFFNSPFGPPKIPNVQLSLNQWMVKPGSTGNSNQGIPWRTAPRANSSFEAPVQRVGQTIVQTLPCELFTCV